MSRVFEMHFFLCPEVHTHEGLQVDLLKNLSVDKKKFSFESFNQNLDRIFSIYFDTIAHRS